MHTIDGGSFSLLFLTFLVLPGFPLQTAIGCIVVGRIRARWSIDVVFVFINRLGGQSGEFDHFSCEVIQTWGNDSSDKNFPGDQRRKDRADDAKGPSLQLAKIPVDRVQPRRTPSNSITSAKITLHHEFTLRDLERHSVSQNFSNIYQDIDGKDSLTSYLP
jgi:hypothetical protein